MYRYAIEKLKAWKDSPDRKPLIMRGARQVGKTWLLKEFGRTCFDSVAYVRLEDNAAMEQLFADSLEPDRLLRGISAQTGVIIKPNETLIILDEVQAVPRALTALKYFNEEAPEYAIAVAGSLLGVALNAGISFPVGKVTFMDLFPMSFSEFLLAMGESSLVEMLQSDDFDSMRIFRERFVDLLKVYYYIGGMPEVVGNYIKEKSFASVRTLQNDILSAYQGDFAKHAGAAMGERCRLVFNSLPRHLAKENKKFVYGVVKQGARGREMDDAVQFLVDAGLVVKVKQVSAPGIPLSAYENPNSFKLFCVDVGLLGALAGIEIRDIIEDNTLLTHFKGALAEQYVCQQLISEAGFKPYYWSAEKSSGEIDFLVSIDGKPVPIEVKAEENLKAKSLATFCQANDLKNGVRLSLADYREESWMRNIPLYAAGSLARV